MSGLCPHEFESRRRRLFYIMVSWPSGLRRSTQVRVYICRRGFESHRNHNISGPVAQWIARKTSNLKVAGSSPARVVFAHVILGFDLKVGWAFPLVSWGISSIGRVPRLQRGGTGIETRILHLYASLAKWLRHSLCKRGIASSNLARG